MTNLTGDAVTASRFDQAAGLRARMSPLGARLVSEASCSADPCRDRWLSLIGHDESGATAVWEQVSRVVCPQQWQIGWWAEQPFGEGPKLASSDIRAVSTEVGVVSSGEHVGFSVPAARRARLVLAPLNDPTVVEQQRVWRASQGAIVVVGPQPDDLVNSYSQVKRWLRAGGRIPMAVMVVGLTQAESVRRVESRLQRTCQRFLKTRIDTFRVLGVQTNNLAKKSPKGPKPSCQLERILRQAVSPEDGFVTPTLTRSLERASHEVDWGNSLGEVPPGISSQLTADPRWQRGLDES